MRVFFSHRSNDKPLLRELRGYLPSWLSAWIDEDQLMFGSDLNVSLRTAIDEEVDFVVLFLSHEAARSVWVRQEIHWALEREEVLGRVFLLPILLGNVREHLEDLGLGGRITIEISDHTQAATRMLAERLTNHLGIWMSENLKSVHLRPQARQRDLTDIGQDIAEALEAIPLAWRPAVDELLSRPFLRSLTSSRIGQIPLTPAQYYQRILREMGRAGEGWEVVAVSMLVSSLWVGDADQSEYAQRNLAATQRGAVIRRLFLIPKDDEQGHLDTIRAQVDSGVEVRLGTYSLLAHVPELDDFVLFKGPDGSRAFIALPSVDGSRRIRSGMLDLTTSGAGRIESAFAEAWEMALPADDILSRQRLRTKPTVAYGEAPGLTLQQRILSAEVISCQQAADARGIPLTNELKTLILQTSEGLVAAHLPGDGVLSLRKVKERLEAAEAYLADPEDLLAIGLSAGTVSAVLDPVWSMPHLVSRRLLDLTEVMTNNGTRTGYFAFDPALLVEARSVVVGDFEK